MNSTFNNLNATGTTAVENMLEAHGESINPNTAFGLSVFAFTMSLIFIAIAGLSGNIANIVIMVPLVFFTIANVLFLYYSTLLKERDSVDYHGLVRVTDFVFAQRSDVQTVSSGNGGNTRGYSNEYQHGYNPEYSNEYQHGYKGYSNNNRRNNNEPTKKEVITWYYDAVTTVDWGYDWACSAFADDTTGSPKQCTSKVKLCTQRISNCNGLDCSETQQDRALEEARECMEKIFKTVNQYTPYDPLVGPSNDLDWPSIVAYGDCNTCEVHLDVASPSSLKGIRTAGFVLLGISFVSLLGLCLLRASGWEYLKKSPRWDSRYTES